MTIPRANPLIAAVLAFLLCVRPPGGGRQHKKARRQPVAILAEMLWLRAVGLISFVASFCFAGAFAVSGSAELRAFTASVAFATLGLFVLAWTKLGFELAAFATSNSERAFEHDVLRRYPAANDG